MKKLYLIPVLAALSLLSLYQCPYFYRIMDAYAIAKTEELLGKELLAAEHETFIREIGQQMGIEEQLFIRKMNYTAVVTWGYHNAVAYFPQFLYVIPLTDRPFLYVSEGFFEDLSPAEQRFLIGHEMVHIKERHVRFSTLIVVLSLILVFVAWWQLRGWLLPRMSSYSSVARSFLLGILLYAGIALPGLLHLAYRRHIEWQADKISIAHLNSYDGGIKFMERCVRIYRLPWCNPYGGWLSDHPSCFERRAYCLMCKHTAERVTT